MDWDNLMRLGLHELRLQPVQFWQLTPHELQVMSGRTAQMLPMARDDLMSLIQAYPDVNHKKERDHGQT